MNKVLHFLWSTTNFYACCSCVFIDNLFS